MRASPAVPFSVSQKCRNKNGSDEPRKKAGKSGFCAGGQKIRDIRRGISHGKERDKEQLLLGRGSAQLAVILLIFLPYRRVLQLSSPTLVPGYHRGWP